MYIKCQQRLWKTRLLITVTLSKPQQFVKHCTRAFKSFLKRLLICLCSEHLRGAVVRLHVCLIFPATQVVQMASWATWNNQLKEWPAPSPGPVEGLISMEWGILSFVSLWATWERRPWWNSQEGAASSVRCQVNRDVSWCPGHSSDHRVWTMCLAFLWGGSSSAQEGVCFCSAQMRVALVSLVRKFRSGKSQDKLRVSYKRTGTLYCGKNEQTRAVHVVDTWQKHNVEWQTSD